MGVTFSGPLNVDYRESCSLKIQIQCHLLFQEISESGLVLLDGIAERGKYGGSTTRSEKSQMETAPEDSATGLTRSQPRAQRGCSTHSLSLFPNLPLQCLFEEFP